MKIKTIKIYIKQIERTKLMRKNKKKIINLKKKNKILKPNKMNKNSKIK